MVFEQLLGHLNVPAESIIYFEDSFKNLVTAKEMGIVTVFVQGKTGVEEGVTHEVFEYNR